MEDRIVTASLAAKFYLEAVMDFAENNNCLKRTPEYEQIVATKEKIPVSEKTAQLLRIGAKMILRIERRKRLAYDLALKEDENDKSTH